VTTTNRDKTTNDFAC